MKKWRHCLQMRSWCRFGRVACGTRTPHCAVHNLWCSFVGVKGVEIGDVGIDEEGVDALNLCSLYASKKLARLV